MAHIKVGKENSASIELYYEDHGEGKPVVLIHGFPLSQRSWERQKLALNEWGYRTIAYDRRGFGQSSQPTVGYDYDTFASDLHKLMEKLDLKEAALVGFSMGTGEVVRYLAKYGSERVERAVLISGLGPIAVKTADNPNGVEPAVFAGIKKAIRDDRATFIVQFLKDFYDVDRLSDRISPPAFRDSWMIGVGASPTGTLACVGTWSTDFRKDVQRIDVPTLIVHGDADRILPYKGTAAVLANVLRGSRLVTIKGAPHGLIWTHAEEVNRELLQFLKARTAAEAGRR